MALISQTQRAWTGIDDRRTREAFAELMKALDGISATPGQVTLPAPPVVTGSVLIGKAKVFAALTEWSYTALEHRLATANLLVGCYDLDGQQQVGRTTVAPNGDISVKWTDPQAGYMVVVRAI